MIDHLMIQMFGVRMHAWTMDETLQVIKERLADGLFTQHVVVNVGKIVNMQSDVLLAESVSSCDIINVDGAGVSIAGRILGQVIPERVTGIDLFTQLLTMAENQYSVYLLGAQDQVIEEVVARIRRDYPQLEIAGYHHGYFWDDEESVAQKIKASGATLLFVAITSPKKENFINQWNESLGVKFVMGVGGSFDVMAGKVQRAPLWMQNYGLEWFFRVMQEPRRLWWRYLSSNLKFLWMLMRGCFDQDYREHGNMKR
ncbi:MAG: WecB/TagA/CpsF family glycosyltransferase [Mariprofundus sp.]|nr:WecB/TagA/CpsF family glycosyltransferase [Mariprofundus sp.]